MDDAWTNTVRFRDCFSELVISKLTPSADRKPRRVKGRKNEIKPVVPDLEKEAADSLVELSEFTEYVADEIFESLPHEFRTLSYRAIQDDAGLRETFSCPLNSALLDDLVSCIPVATIDSLSTYGLLDTTDGVDLVRVLEPVLGSYVAACTKVPPENDTLVRGSECEMCERDRLPLTYHHLIPRAVQAKAVKRGWAKEWELQKVAWLCRACHSFVHRMAGNEELAKEWNDMDVIMEREDVRAWAQWVRRVRWKKQ